jgi:hypothetical protein
MAIDPKININENQVIFKRENGHKHDGLTSNLIDYTKYSIFDFPVYPVAPVGTSRRRFEDTNVKNLESFIISTVENRVLNPKGIAVQANTITAREIASGTITSGELASNIILVNNVIKSKNYNGTINSDGTITAQGNAGWAITHAGSAEFSSASIRGAIIADSVSTPGIDILSDGSISSTNFNVTASGDLTATNANISGTITATSGSIANWSINSSGLRNAAGIRTVNLYPAVGFASDPVLDIDFGGTRTGVSADGLTGWNSSSIDLRLTTSSLFLRYGTVDVDYYIMQSTSTSSSSDQLVRDSSDGRIMVKSSNRDLKENITPISDSMSLIEKLSPQKFNWKLTEENKGDELSILEKQTHKSMGFILEDVLEVSPELVTWRKKEDGTLFAGYWKVDDFVALAIQGIKELNTKVSILESEILELKGMK